MQIRERLSALSWPTLNAEISSRGYSLITNLLSRDECDFLVSLYDRQELFRKTVVMERHRFGKGEYKYFTYPLPELVQIIRETTYGFLVPVANQWMKELRMSQEYPGSLGELLEICKRENQEKATALILKYGPGGFNTLHQDLYGRIYFPFQIVLFLNEVGNDYVGGEFVLTEQLPRAQSRATVLKPQLGDMLIFTTNFRPIMGTRGYYRATMKHGVSEIRTGIRHTLGIIFHDATA
jgi:hypothetical protein